MKKPYFSILIPTKNRSHLLENCIKSVLSQSFCDYELIICDNDDTDETSLVVQKIMDVRVKYVRTGKISMVSNWNRALNESVGRNVIVLPDKMIFYKDSLTKIRDLIDLSPSGVVVWNYDSVNDREYSVSLHSERNLGHEILSTNQVLENITTDIMRSIRIMPRGLCTSVPRHVIDGVTGYAKKNFYEEAAPDIVSAMKILSTVEKYIYSKCSLSMVTSNNNSNGFQILKRNPNAYEYFMGKEKFPDQYGFRYMDSDWIVVNTVVADYLNQRKKIGGLLKSHKISNQRYFEMLLKELALTSMLLKKFAWSMGELKQLFLRGDGLLKNTIYFLRCLLVWLVRKASHDNQGAYLITFKSEAEFKKFIRSVAMGLDLKEQKNIRFSDKD